MSENTSEILRQGFVPLFSESEGVDLSDDAFSGKPRELFDVGKVKMYGNRDFLYEGMETEGIAIIDGKVVIDSASNLRNKGLFNIDVFVYGVKPGTADVNCRMVLPNYGLEFESDIFMSEDEINKESLVERYSGSTEEWTLKGSNKQYYFFAPGDAKFLSGEMLFALRFFPVKRK